MSGRMRRVADIEWTTWTPRDHATLLFVVQDERVLLIRKKRGLGAGKVNGPGGRLHAGESERAAAIREVQEELCVTPRDITRLGELSFQFTDGYGLFCGVFRAEGLIGEPRETDEAIPLWTPVDQVPFGEMWADDRLWFPHLLAWNLFRGRFIFDGDAMLDHDLRVEVPKPAPAGLLESFV